MCNEVSFATRHLAPSGRLRAAINFGNAVLAQKDPETGEAKGVSIALAQELARRLNVPCELVCFESAGTVVSALDKRPWDIAFLAIDPLRAQKLSFTSPYVLIEGSYLVPVDSALHRNEEVDTEGIRIAVGKNAAYDLFLSRTLTKAELVRASTTPGAVDLFLEKELDVAAGVRLPLLRFVKSHPEFRLLDGHFMVIEQAMAVPKDESAVIPFLETFLQTVKTSGFIKEALEENMQYDVTVAP